MTPTGPVTLRAAKGSDARAVAEFQTRVWREAYRGLVPRSYLDRVGVEERLERWAGRFATESRRVAVAESVGEVVGVISWAPSDASGVPPLELTSLYVGATHRGTMVAARLLEASIGAKPAFLWVFTDNPRAHAFYVKHGFAGDGHRAVDPDTGVLEQRMVRS